MYKYLFSILFMDYSTIPVDVLRLVKRYRDEMDYSAKYKNVMIELKNEYKRYQYPYSNVIEVYIFCGSKYRHRLRICLICQKIQKTGISDYYYCDNWYHSLRAY